VLSRDKQRIATMILSNPVGLVCDGRIHIQCVTSVISGKLGYMRVEKLLLCIVCTAVSGVLYAQKYVGKLDSIHTIKEVVVVGNNTPSVIPAWIVRPWILLPSTSCRLRRTS